MTSPPVATPPGFERRPHSEGDGGSNWRFAPFLPTGDEARGEPNLGELRSARSPFFGRFEVPDRPEKEKRNHFSPAWRGPPPKPTANPWPLRIVCAKVGREGDCDAEPHQEDAEDGAEEGERAHERVAVAEEAVRGKSGEVMAASDQRVSKRVRVKFPGSTANHERRTGSRGGLGR
jgi:hypothetical protein